MRTALSMRNMAYRNVDRFARVEACSLIEASLYHRRRRWLCR